MRRSKLKNKLKTWIVDFVNRKKPDWVDFTDYRVSEDKVPRGPIETAYVNLLERELKSNIAWRRRLAKVGMFFYRTPFWIWIIIYVYYKLIGHWIMLPWIGSGRLPPVDVIAFRELMLQLFIVIPLQFYLAWSRLVVAIEENPELVDMKKDPGWPRHLVRNVIRWQWQFVAFSFYSWIYVFLFLWGYQFLDNTSWPELTIILRETHLINFVVTITLVIPIFILWLLKKFLDWRWIRYRNKILKAANRPIPKRRSIRYIGEGGPEDKF